MSELVQKQLVGGQPAVEKRLAWAIENFRFRAAQAVGRLRTGKTTLAEFSEWGYENIKDHLYTVAEIGKGERLTRKEIYAVRRTLKPQVKFWDNFAQSIANQRQTLKGLKGVELEEAEDKLYAKFGRRAQSYSGAVAAEGTKWAMAAQFPEGQWFRWTKTPVESCETCIGRDGKIYRMKDGRLPFYPKNGSTICLYNCKCFWKPITKAKARRILMGAGKLKKKTAEEIEEMFGWEAEKGGKGPGYHAPHVGRPGEIGGSRKRSAGPKVAALPKGTKIRWHAGLRSEARAEPDNAVFLGPKFWGPHMSDEARADVLAHEFGHVLEQVSGALTGKGFDRALEALRIPMPDWVKGRYEWWGYGGDAKVTEALSWAYSDYVAGRLKKGPAYDFVGALVDKHPEFGLVDFPAISAGLEPGPEGGKLTIFDETQKSSHCSVCGRLLTDPKSVVKGIGPVCEKHMGPGSHSSGSPQSAHAGGRGKAGAMQLKPMTAPAYRGSDNPTKEILNLLGENLLVPEGFDREEVDEWGWEEAEDETASMVKASIAERLSQETGISEGDTSKFIRQWAISSNGSDMRSLGVQESAVKEFGMPLSTWQQSEIRKAKERGGAGAEYLMPEVTQRKLLRAMYNQTQADLAQAGLSKEGTIRVFRGIKYGDTLPWSNEDVIPFEGNALESWTVSSDVARNFSDGIIFAADIPVSSVLATARSGFGCLKEGEILAFGSVPGSKVLVWNEIEEFEEQEWPPEDWDYE